MAGKRLEEFTPSTGVRSASCPGQRVLWPLSMSLSKQSTPIYLPQNLLSLWKNSNSVFLWLHLRSLVLHAHGDISKPANETSGFLLTGNHIFLSVSQGARLTCLASEQYLSLLYPLYLELCLQPNRDSNQICSMTEGGESILFSSPFGEFPARTQCSSKTSSPLSVPSMHPQTSIILEQ